MTKGSDSGSGPSRNVRGASSIISSGGSGSIVPRVEGLGPEVVGDEGRLGGRSGPRRALADRGRDDGRSEQDRPGDHVRPAEGGKGVVEGEDEEKEAQPVGERDREAGHSQ